MPKQADPDDTGQGAVDARAVKKQPKQKFGRLQPFMLLLVVLLTACSLATNSLDSFLSSFEVSTLSFQNHVNSTTKKVCSDVKDPIPVVLAIIVAPTYPAAAPLCPGLTEEVMSFIGSRGGRVIDRLDVWNCQGDKLDETERFKMYTHINEVTPKICDTKHVFEHYALNIDPDSSTYLHPDQVLIAIGPTISFIDYRRLWEFAEYVRGEHGCSGYNVNLWVGNQMSREEPKSQVDSDKWRPSRWSVSPLSKGGNEEEEAFLFGMLGRHAGAGTHQAAMVYDGMTYSVSNSSELSPQQVIFRLEDRHGRPSILADKTRTKPAVFWTVFAWQEDRGMHLQVSYILELLDKKVVDEVHFHDFTCMSDEPNFNNRRWLYSIMRQMDGVFVAPRYTCEYVDYYSFYAHSNLLPDDVLLKVDDGIIFVDTTRVEGFVKAVRYNPEIFLWSANVVNNGKGAYFQMMDGALDGDIKAYKREEFRGDGVGQHFLKEKEGRWHHEAFLSDPQRFFDSAERTGRICHGVRSRISINFVAFLGKHMKDSLDYVSAIKNGDDEHAVTYYASVEKNRTLAMYMPLVVSHASFGPQGELGLEAVRMYSNVTIRNNSTWTPDISPDKPIDFDTN